MPSKSVYVSKETLEMLKAAEIHGFNLNWSQIATRAWEKEIKKAAENYLELIEPTLVPFAPYIPRNTSMPLIQGDLSLFN